MQGTLVLVIHLGRGSTRALALRLGLSLFVSLIISFAKAVRWTGLWESPARSLNRFAGWRACTHQLSTTHCRRSVFARLLLRGALSGVGYYQGKPHCWVTTKNLRMIDPHARFNQFIVLLLSSFGRGACNGTHVWCQFVFFGDRS